MDRKLLDALNNLSYALEEIANSLKDNKSGKGNQSATTTALQGGKLDKQLQSIDKGVKKLQSDNKKILKNQETLLTLSKKKPAEKDPLDKATDPKQKNKLKDGLASIMMIAVGVLAIGLAFKLIGKVNFLSVIALAIALPLVAMAFEKIAKMKDLKSSEIKNIVLVTVAMAAAIAASSWVLQLVKPVGIFKLFTAIMIAAAFGAISYGLGNLLTGFKKANIDKSTALKLSWQLPLVFIALSAAIAASSWVLQLVKPVGIFKLFTAILIAAAFGAIAYGLGNLLIGVKKAKIDKKMAIDLAWQLPLVFIALSAAIAVSSWVLQLVKPVGIFKLFTAIMIAAAFAVIAYGLGNLLVGFKKSKIDKKTATDLAWQLPLVFIALSAAIAASSWILQLVKPVGIFKLFTAILIAAMFTVISFVIPHLMKGIKNVKVKDVLTGGLVLLAITAAIVAASWLISVMKPISIATMFKLIFLSISLGIATIALAGTIYILNKIGKLSDYIKGGVVVLVLALTIAVASMILSIGKYKNYPSPKWALGVGLALAFFGIGAVLLGTQVMNPFFYAGLGMILVVGGTIVALSYVLSAGQYKKFASKEWAVSTTLLLGTFGLLAVALGLIAPIVALGVVSALAIVGFIYAADLIFRKGEFKKYPSKSWVLPTTLVIAAFAATMVGLALISPFLLVGIPAALAVVGMIWAIDKIFQKGKFKKYPSREWSRGVAQSIADMVKIMDNTSFTSVLKGGLSSLFGGGVDDVAKAILKLDNIFSKGKFVNYPKNDFMKNISSNVRTYADLAKYIVDSKADKLNVKDITDGMIGLANGYSLLANGVAKLNTQLQQIDVEKLTALKNLTGSIVLLSLMDSDQFEDMMDALEDKAQIFIDVMNDLDKSGPEKVKGGTKGAPAAQVRGKAAPTGPPAKTMGDLYSIMQQVNQNLANIAKTNDNMSKYVDEIRSSDIDLKKKK